MNGCDNPNSVAQGEDPPQRQRPLGPVLTQGALDIEQGVHDDDQSQEVSDQEATAVDVPGLIIFTILM